jgi:DNA-binding transcriptional ArsR family regulator
MQIQERLECAARASEILKCLGNKHRLLVLCELTKHDRSVRDLEEILEISQPVISQHLWRLRNMGLVEARRNGKRVIYSVATVEAAQLIGLIRELSKNSGAKFNTPVSAFNGTGAAQHAD